jgi:hypothetical protein
MSLEDKVGGAIDITGRDWTGLPWNVDPEHCSERDWTRVLPGTYYFDRIEDGWVYIRLGGAMHKLDLGDVKARWPNL